MNTKKGFFFRGEKYTSHRVTAPVVASVKFYRMMVVVVTINVVCMCPPFLFSIQQPGEVVAIFFLGKVRKKMKTRRKTEFVLYKIPWAPRVERQAKTPL